MRRAKATLKSERASRYLQAMCKHFAHKVAVAYDTHHGKAALPTGALDMHVEGDDVLHFVVEANDEASLAQAKYVVDAHIVRFAFREKLERLDWSDDDASPDEAR